MSEDQTEPLSERELELVCLLARGLSNKEIARELYISPNTVKVHLRNIYGKLKVSSRTEATMLALRMGWVELDVADGEPGEPSDLSAPGPEGYEAPTGDAVVLRGPAIQPLARWQWVYMVLSALLVGMGLWLIWPRQVQPSQSFTDRGSPASSWLPGQTSRWQALAQMPTARSRLALVTYGGQIYAIAGETAAGVSAAVDVYSISEDDWSRGTEKPTATANVGAVAIDGVIYVPGGVMADRQISDRLEVYDPEEETWSSRSSMLEGVYAYAIAAHGGQLYLFGGWNDVSHVARSVRYDPETDTWHELAPMPTARAYAGAGTVGEHIYVVGGYDGTNEYDVCEVYDTQLGIWQSCPPMTVARGGVGVTVIAGTLYVVGGGWNSYLVENEYYSPLASDPAQGTWETFPSPLLQEWRNLGVVAGETTLYAIGGWNGDYQGANQAYRALNRLYLPSVMGESGSSE